MTMNDDRLYELASLVEKHAPEEGLNYTVLENDVATYRSSQPHSRKPEVYQPAIFILGQGSKTCHVGGREFDYSAGNCLTLVLPMPLEAVVHEASPEKPLLMVGMRMDLHKIASLLLRLDEVERPTPRPAIDDPSGILAAPLHDDLLDAVVRLLKTLDNPTDATILGEPILDEIYYRIIRDDNAGPLRYLLQQREQIQQISRAVEHIHQNLDQVISVEELASLANMSTSGFHRSFKEVMHLSPLQYAKSMKLHRAQALILEGKRANEAGYMVGYNSPAQFSREYKRQFGYAPSAT